jgi:hypothetical protein
MKRSILYIYDKYPNVQKKIEGKQIPLTNIESVFHQMCLFINDPEKYSFNTNLLYQYLKNEDLIIALQTLITFFQRDTYLIEENNNSFVNAEEIKNTTLYNQKMLSDYLKNNGLNFSPNKVSVYYKRMKLPKPDLVINDTPYWFERTAELFMQEETYKQNTKN